MKNKISNLDWVQLTEEMHQKGRAIIPNLLSESQCNELIQLYEQEGIYRKTVTMERHRFGKGEYKYFDYPLPDLLQTIRENIYPYLASIANAWMSVLKIGIEYPPTLKELHGLCKEQGQLKPTVLILKYGESGFNTLHQDLYGEVYFPIQMVLFLSNPDEDYEGGEFVMTEQVPRAQSKAIVLRPAKGDALLLSTNFRPIKGAKGYYRANMRHGVSEVKKGHRSTLGIIFHDALS
ncbi:MAG: 2OG-Fe(II) oxygenase [Cyclobacteriaceae bacterium]